MKCALSLLPPQHLIFKLNMTTKAEKQTSMLLKLWNMLGTMIPAKFGHNRQEFFKVPYRRLQARIHGRKSKHDPKPDQTFLGTLTKKWPLSAGS